METIWVKKEKKVLPNKEFQIFWSWFHRHLDTVKKIASRNKKDTVTIESRKELVKKKSNREKKNKKKI